MLIGMFFIVKPVFSFTIIPSVVGFISAILSELSLTMIRYLNNKVDSEAIVFYFFAFSLLASLPLMLMNFTKPTIYEIVFLLGIGLCALVGQFGLTYAYTYSPESEVSIYNYLIIITSTITGYIFFMEIPDIFSFIGSTFILLTAYYLYLHNKKKDLE